MSNSTHLLNNAKAQERIDELEKELKILHEEEQRQSEADAEHPKEA